MVLARMSFHMRIPVHYLVIMSGLAALSWEVMWQIKSTLALGVSAWGAALTLSITMGGMCAGSLLTGRILANKTIARPTRIYALLEFAIGISGLLLGQAFSAVEKLDTIVYSTTPGAATFVHLFGIVISIGIPAMAMGATIPVLTLVARQYQIPLSILYGLNTLGAAAGALIVAFSLIPLFGVTHAIWIVSALNIAVAIAAWQMHPGPALHLEKSEAKRETPPAPAFGTMAAAILVFVTGFTTFTLEIAWFRALTAAFLSTTDAFAIMLSCALIAIGAGAGFVPALKKRNIPIGVYLCWSGILVFLSTPVIERLDLFLYAISYTPMLIFMQWFIVSLCTIGPPFFLLGIALPWILDQQISAKKTGVLYGINTFAAIAGSIIAAWLFLPSFGFARTAWIAGIIAACTGILFTPKEKRISLCIMGMAALAAAVFFESGAGRTRVLGATHFSTETKPSRILESFEGPDVTATAAEYADGGRILFIDGFVATQQPQGGYMLDHVHYMPWMGYLPMLAVSSPENTLVICFGTGQTANAVRKENPAALDIVDVNKNIFKLAHNFLSNENVLQDSRVTPIVMDGRAYLRRTDKTYDVITLEPMPPSFAGVNALYSREFYKLAKKRLSHDGVIAQWLPFHLVTKHYSASIAKTFQSVFPNAILWIDPVSKVGILLGSANDNGNLGMDWPGYKRTGTRDLPETVVKEAVRLDRYELPQYAAEGEIISDDNQILSYGKAAHLLRDMKLHGEKNEFD
jgi:spermidine synthase